MKNKLIEFACLFLSVSVFSQIGIGKPSVSSASVSLEFASGNKGLVLPWVSSSLSVTGAVNGTMIYDITDHKVKVKYAAGWKDLSVDAGSTIDPITGVDGIIVQNALQELTSGRVGIGSGVPSSVPGILVLEDSSKAMVLPKVTSPHLNIINPSPGLMAYDTVTKQLAVFNGKMWSFWKS